MKRFFLFITILTLATLACQLPGVTPLPTPQADTQLPAATIPAPAPASVNPVILDGTLTSLYQQVIPGVVSVRTDTGQGSGFVYDTEGHIITNQHVVDGANIVEVAFSSGFKSYGTVIGSDSDADIAVVKVDAPVEELHPLII